MTLTLATKSTDPHPMEHTEVTLEQPQFTEAQSCNVQEPRCQTPQRFIGHALTRTELFRQHDMQACQSCTHTLVFHSQVFVMRAELDFALFGYKCMDVPGKKCLINEVNVNALFCINTAIIEV